MVGVGDGDMGIGAAIGVEAGVLIGLGGNVGGAAEPNTCYKDRYR